MSLTINFEKIKAFLTSCNELERIYIGDALCFSSVAEKLVKENNLTKEKFCEMMQIEQKDYESYLNGSFRYRIDDLTTLNYYAAELAGIRIKIKLEKAKEQ